MIVMHRYRIGGRAIKVDPPKISSFFVFDEEVVVLLGLA